MVPKVKDQIGDDSLMNSGTWAYLGSEKKESDRYLFWTSVNTDEIGPGKEIPVIIVTGDGKFYISKSTTAKRTGVCYASGGLCCVAETELFGVYGYLAVIICRRNWAI